MVVYNVLVNRERKAPRIKQESGSRDRREAANRPGIAARHGRRARTATSEPSTPEKTKRRTTQ